MIKLLLRNSYSALALTLFISLFFAKTEVCAMGASPFEFSCVAMEKFETPQLYYLDNGKYEPIEIPFGMHSDLYTHSGVGTFGLYTKSIGPDGQASYVICGQSAIIPDCKRMLFVVNRAKVEGPIQLRIFALNDTLSDFPPGSFRFINMTRLPLKVSFDGKSDAIRPGSISVISPKGDTGFYPFTIDGANGRRFYETKLYGQFRGRETVLIGPPRHDRKRLTIKFLTQVIPL